MSDGIGPLNTIELEVRDRVAVLTLNRPRVRNAIDAQMRADLRAAILHLATDADVRCLVITGAGSAFCSGGDIRGMRERLEQGDRVGEIGWRRQRELHETLSKLHFLDRPTIAAVNGPAFGLGLDLALCCDFIFAASTATLSASFVQRGLVPDGGGMYFLPRRVGLARAKDLIFSGRVLTAAEALAAGLVDRVAEPDRLLDECRGYAAELARLPAVPQALAKNVLNRTFELSLDQANAMGAEAQAICYSSPDHREQVLAFLERSKAPRE